MTHFRSFCFSEAYAYTPAIVGACQAICHVLGTRGFVRSQPVWPWLFNRRTVQRKGSLTQERRGGKYLAAQLKIWLRWYSDDLRCDFVERKFFQPFSLNIDTKTDPFWFFRSLWLTVFGTTSLFASFRLWASEKADGPQQPTDEGSTRRCDVHHRRCSGQLEASDMCRSPSSQVMKMVHCHHSCLFLCLLNVSIFTRGYHPHSQISPVYLCLWPHSWGVCRPPARWNAPKERWISRTPTTSPRSVKAKGQDQPKRNKKVGSHGQRDRYKKH